ncbi:MAG: LacI family DNA-binding transcriptional regulator [Devosia sp.]
MAKVTLSKIAAVSGLSKFAVSRALAGKTGVSEDTRKRVEKIASDLGYQKPAAKNEEPTIGVIFHDADLINSELHLLIQSGVQAEAHRLGYRTSMRWSHDPAEMESLIAACSGAILVGTHDRPCLDRAYAVGKPLVRTGWLDALEQVDQVCSTDHEAGSAVALYLLELGHRSIAYVQGTPGYRGRVERHYGAREVFERQGDIEFTNLKFDAENRFSEVLAGLHEQGTIPTAFFCAHDGLAVTVISELLRLGYQIPEDVSVIGFGDYSAAQQISPSLTTVKVNGNAIGTASVRLIDDRVNGRLPAVPVRLQITNVIVGRQSTGPANPTRAFQRTGSRESK